MATTKTLFSSGAKAKDAISPHDVAREAELIGKLKNVDILVRNSDVQMGIFEVLADAEADQMLALSVKDLEKYEV